MEGSYVSTDTAADSPVYPSYASALGYRNTVHRTVNKICRNYKPQASGACLVMHWPIIKD